MVVRVKIALYRKCVPFYNDDLAFYVRYMRRGRRAPSGRRSLFQYKEGSLWAVISFST